MWWLSGSTPDFRGRGLGFESGISHNDPGAYDYAGSVQLYWLKGKLLYEDKKYFFVILMEEGDVLVRRSQSCRSKDDITHYV